MAYNQRLRSMGCTAVSEPFSERDDIVLSLPTGVWTKTSSPRTWEARFRDVPAGGALSMTTGNVTRLGLDNIPLSGREPAACHPARPRSVVASLITRRLPSRVVSAAPRRPGRGLADAALALLMRQRGGLGWSLKRDTLRRSIKRTASGSEERLDGRRGMTPTSRGMESQAIPRRFPTPIGSSIPRNAEAALK